MSSEGPDDLGDEIARARATLAEREATKQKATKANDGSISAGAYALRYGAEFGASIFIGGLIGYWIDVFAGTKPWALLAFGAFGFAAGVRAMMRAYKELNAQALKQTQEPQAPEDGN
ncbi:AtpZ/AtpI family protein [Hyphomonas johnsonii]|jgi:ATP synthase protein I|uniref:ATP synthase protein I n=1 Tax=Hyphomonas johnsonii MHS-2 TaxID=1280950 RepID=A0A059FS77_9PROT|nr:AtpZ/AtpI family protein [Hyphomonas johnsonii]KCZ93323.1 putative ATP synthase subunit I [Hyphomonas johnsonii MHS-2]